MYLYLKLDIIYLHVAYEIFYNIQHLQNIQHFNLILIIYTHNMVIALNKLFLAF